jgi:hypothetical protein
MGHPDQAPHLHARPGPQAHERPHRTTAREPTPTSQRRTTDASHRAAMKITATKPSSRSLLALGIVALLLVLTSTGGAVAGAMITGKQVKDGTITTKDVKDKTLTSTDLAPATIKALAGKAGSAGAQGSEGPRGPAGQPGATGPAGPQGIAGPVGAAGARGAAGANGLTVVTIRSTSIEPSPTGGAVEVMCHDDERAVSASYETSAVNDGKPSVTSSYPITKEGEAVAGEIPLGSGWYGALSNLSDAPDSIVSGSIAVVCAKP